MKDNIITQIQTIIIGIRPARPQFGYFFEQHSREYLILEGESAPEAAVEAAYLHPTIWRYQRGEQVSEKHIQDDLESQWHRDEYILPARAFRSPVNSLNPQRLLA